MTHKVICISSQDGAGAQRAALLVASSLGFRLIDEDIVTRAAVEAGSVRISSLMSSGVSQLS